MNRRFEVAGITTEACKMRPEVGRLPVDCTTTSHPQRVVRSEAASFAFAASDKRTLALLEAVWGADVRQQESGEDARIVCAPAEAHSGRFVDPKEGRQLLAFDYAPFTLIKQALRWEYGRQSPQSGLMPVHGVVVEAAGRRVCISARGQAGKSFLADTWLELDHSARVLVDDWSLLEADTRRIRRTGDAALHVRGSVFERGSAQLHGAEAVLVELCEAEPRSDETRYLVDRTRLQRFANDGQPRTLDAIVLVQGPRDDRFEVRDDAVSVQGAFAEEASTFWDDSLVGLPEEAAGYLRDAWSRLLNCVPVVVMRGHRSQTPERVVEALRAALGM